VLSFVPGSGGGGGRKVFATGAAASSAALSPVSMGSETGAAFAGTSWANAAVSDDERTSGAAGSSVLEETSVVVSTAAG
jgi:hypothetical protein